MEAYQPFNLEQYRKQCAESMKKFSALDEQIAAERAAEKKILANMTPKQRLEYLVQKDADLNETENKFKNVVQVTSEKRF